MTPAQRRAKLRRFFETTPMYQFGEKGDSTTNQGQEGCTHSNVEALVKIWHNKNITQDDVSKAVGYKPEDQGLTPIHLEKAFKAFDLPYKMVYAKSALYVVEAADKGPCLVSVMYGLHPECYGAHYMGQRADGKENGYTRPLGKSGKNQLTGFTGGHSEMVIGSNKRKDGILDVIVHDPNHRSPARPEEFPYDRMTINQFRRMFDGYKTINKLRRTVAAIPLEAYNG